jgi:hypothetical protein
MKNDGISQNEPRKVKLDEAKICQLVAVLDKMWPDIKPVKPDLKLVAPQHKPQPSISSDEIQEVIREVNRSARRDQLKVLLDQKWGPAQDAAPKHRVNGDDTAIVPCSSHFGRWVSRDDRKGIESGLVVAVLLALPEALHEGL